MYCSCKIRYFLFKTKKLTISVLKKCEFLFSRLITVSYQVVRGITSVWSGVKISLLFRSLFFCYWKTCFNFSVEHHLSFPAPIRNHHPHFYSRYSFHLKFLLKKLKRYPVLSGTISVFVELIIRVIYSILLLNVISLVWIKAKQWKPTQKQRSVFPIWLIQCSASCMW